MLCIISGRTEGDITTIRQIDKLVLSAILTFPYTGFNYSLGTEFCRVQVGCVLLQEKSDDTPKPGECWLGPLTNAGQINYTTQRKSLATVWFVSILQPYVEGLGFAIQADHNSLK